MDNLIKYSLELLAIDSVQSEATPTAPFGQGTADALTYVLNLAKGLGFKTVNHDNYIGYAECGEGEEFAILGHLDTVPIGEGWTHNPLGELSDDRIYGRGALDDKLPMLCCLLACGELLKTKQPKKKIKIIFGLNEESGWKCIDHFNEVDKLPKIGFSPDADFPVINCEKGIVNYKVSLPLIKDFFIKSGERANIVPNICEASLNGKNFITKGISAHAANPYNGENAIIKMLALLSKDNIEIKRLHEKLCDYYGSGLELDISDEVSGRLTQNVGMAYCDDKLNFILDIRYPVTFDENFILSKLKKAFPDGEITRTHYHLPLYVEKDNPLVTTLLSVYNECTGSDSKPISIGGGTYSRALPLGVAFGPVFPDSGLDIHCPDEYIPLKQLRLAYEIYKKAIDKLCF